jgi:streptogramin lyase
VRFTHPKLASLAPVAMAIFAVMAPVVAGCSREHPQVQAQAQAQAAPPPQLPAVEFVGAWGVRGDLPGQLDRPVGPAVDAAGRIYLADRGTGFVQKFEAGGTALLSFEDSAARSAVAIAVDSGGGIYLADARAGEIRIFFPEGDLIRVLHAAPQHGFNGPYGFSIGADGRLFVPDPNGGKIQVLNSHGQLVKVWKVAAGTETAGKQSRPISAVATLDGSVYVLDDEATRAGRILKFSGEGAQVAAWEPDAAAGPVLALAVSPKYVFALHASSPRLQVWTLDGQPRLSDDLGGRLAAAPPTGPSSGTPAAAPRQAASLAISSRGELVVLVPDGDPAGPRVLRFRIHLDSP